jgi:hypothetical protein
VRIGDWIEAKDDAAVRLMCGTQMSVNRPVNGCESRRIDVM